MCSVMSTLGNPMDCNLPGFSARGILQAGILEWDAISSSKDLLNVGIEPMSLVSPALGGRLFTASATWEAKLEQVACKRDFCWSGERGVAANRKTDTHHKRVEFI